MGGCDARTQGASIAALSKRLRTPQPGRPARPGDTALFRQALLVAAAAAAAAATAAGRGLAEARRRRSAVRREDRELLLHLRAGAVRALRGLAVPDELL